MALVTVLEASQRLGLTQDTVKRRLRKGALPGERLPRPQGYVWFVELDYDESTMPEQGANSVEQGGVNGVNGTMSGHGDDSVNNREVTRLDEMVTMLREQLDAKDNQIRELHVLLQQAALPAPREDRRWWRLWR